MLRDKKSLSLASQVATVSEGASWDTDALSSMQNRSDGTSILFVGNSYTKLMSPEDGYNIDIPSLLEQLAAANGMDVAVDAVTRLGWGLGSLTRDAKENGQWIPADRTVEVNGQRMPEREFKSSAYQAMASNTWDYIVLQEKSGDLFADGIADHREAVAKYFELLKRSGHSCPEIVLYQPPAYNDADHDQVRAEWRQNEIETARQYGAEVSPVGDVWAAAQQSNKARYDHMYVMDEPGEPGFDAAPDKKDTQHPDLNGCYLIAMTIYTSIFDRLPRKLPSSWPRAFCRGLRKHIRRNVCRKEKELDFSSC